MILWLAGTSIFDFEIGFCGKNMEGIIGTLVTCDNIYKCETTLWVIWIEGYFVKNVYMKNNGIRLS